MKRLALTLIATTAIASDAPPLEGLWLHVSGWQLVPDGIYEDGDVHDYSNAAIMNLCPGGDLRVATGVVYRSKRDPTLALGPSDGLAIYRGTWSANGRGLSVTYRLDSAELQRVPDDIGTIRESRLTRVDGDLEFAFIARDGRTWPLHFSPAAKSEKRVIDRFVECGKT